MLASPRQPVRVPVASPIPFLAGSAADKKAVVAIDFGATQSGFAYATTDKPNQVVTSRTRGSDKEPTCALFDRETRNLLAFGFHARDTYLKLLAGEVLLTRFRAEPHKLASEYLFFDGNIKMRLWGNRRDKGLLQCTTVRGRYQMPLIDVVAAILQHLKETALATIREDNPHLCVGQQLTVSDVLWVITVPAIWEEGDKQFMRQAALEAGIIRELEDSDLLIALEPECAAMMVQVEGFKLQAGDKVMTLDCGGGTVDICCVEVLETGKRLRLRQLMEPTGGDWGSTRIDRLFYDFIRDLIGERNLQYCYTRQAALLELRNDWENLKCSLTSADFKANAKPRRLSLASVLGEIKLKLSVLVDRYNHKESQAAASAAAAAAGGDNNAPVVELPSSYQRLKTGGKLSLLKTRNPFRDSTVLLLPPELLLSFFDPVVNNIVEHVDDLLDRYRLDTDVTHMMLVGGFGSCDLLRERLNERFAAVVGRDVIVAERAGAAVGIGAVAFGMQPGVIASRMARLTIGLKATVPYDRTIHRKNPAYMACRFRDEERQMDLVRNVFKPFVLRGQEVDTLSEVTHTFGPRSKSWDSVKFDIYVSEDKDVTLVTAPGCRRLAKIVVPVTPGTMPQLKCALQFGFTEILCTVTNLTTNHKEKISLQYDMDLMVGGQQQQQQGGKHHGQGHQGHGHTHGHGGAEIDLTTQQTREATTTTVIHYKKNKNKSSSATLRRHRTSAIGATTSTSTTSDETRNTQQQRRRRTRSSSRSSSRSSRSSRGSRRSSTSSKSTSIDDQ